MAAVLLFLVIRYAPNNKQMDPGIYYGEAGPEEAWLILDNETLQEARGLVRSEGAYLPLGVVTGKLNAGYYWDQDSQSILYATTTQVEETPAAASSGAEVLLVGDQVYLRTDFVARHTDMDVVVAADPARIVIWHTFKERDFVQAAKDTALRYRGGIKSEILKKVSAGEYLLFEEALKDWIKVSSLDGYTGYVKKGHLSDAHLSELPRTFTEETFSFLSLGTPVNLTWDVISNMESNDYLEQRIQYMTGVNVICPTWYSFSDNAGNFTDYSSAAYVQKAHERGLQVWGLLDNFSPSVSTYEITSHRASREHLIDGLIRSALEKGLDGLNIDLEALAPETVPHVLEFLRELSIRTHQHGLILSFDNPVPENYTNYYNRAEQARAIDYSILMGYDEHYDGDQTAGSVASLPWVEQGVQDTLKEVPADRVILAIPFYTRKWWSQAGTVHSEVVWQSGQQALLAGAAAQIWWNNELSQNVAAWEADGLDYQMWMEDEQSLAPKVGLVHTYQLAGIASWRLGLEINEIWAFLTAQLAG